jgi:glycosyltransferase involved in cell wall biosynthesis
MASNEPFSPKVSIVVPSYNHARYIESTISSILNQDYKNLEIIVIDDGSTDSSVSILKTFGEKIVLVLQQNQGQAATRNNAIKLATGEFIAFLDSDDLYMPCKISSQIKTFEMDNSLALVYTDFLIINEDGAIVREVKCPSPAQKTMAFDVLSGNFICNASVMLRKKCFETEGYFDESVAPAADGDMWLRLLTRNFIFGHIAKPLVKYRVHQKNQSNNYALMKYHRDIIHMRALQSFIHNNYLNSSADYYRLSANLMKSHSYKTAKEALIKSMEYEFGVLKILKWVQLSILDMEVITRAISIFKKIEISIKAIT